MAEYFVHDDEESSIHQDTKDDDVSVISIDESISISDTSLSESVSINSNIYAYENRRASAELDRSRCYPWTKYIESNQGNKQKDIDGPNFAIAGGLDRNVVTWDMKEYEIRYTKGGFG